MPSRKFDLAPYIVVPAIALLLSGVSVLSFRLPTHADAMPHAAVSTPLATPAEAASANNPVPSMAPGDDGDGDGDELLEHWGDPKYSREERIQLAGMGALFAGAAGAMTWKRAARARRSGNASKA